MNKSTFGIALALLMTSTVARAQVAILSPEQIATYKQELPAAAKTAAPKALQGYLQQLQKDKNATPNDVANGVRVAQDVSKSTLAAGATFAAYSVPAMSPMMRLPDAYPADGTFSGEVRIALAQDQYEDGSFVLYPFADQSEVQLKLSPLVSADKSVFPAQNLDLRVVKVWYQNGNRWYSFYNDPGLKLVPELLLHDENLIRVDTVKQANYARVTTATGTREAWISAPPKLDTGFDHYQDGFADAKTLQPVRLNAGEFKQFVLTAHATPDTKPGIYRGHVTVSAKGQKSQSIPVAIRVLSYQLPLPKTNYDVKKDFVVSFFGGWPRINPDSKAFMPTLRNLRAHNVLEIGPDVSLAPNKELSHTPPELAQKNVQAMKEAGFRTSQIFGGGITAEDFAAPTLSIEEQAQQERMAKWYRDFYNKEFGSDSNVFIMSGDEPGAQWLIKHRPSYRILHRNKLQSFIAGWQPNNFAIAGYNLEGRPIAASPGNTNVPNQWNQIGGGYTSVYAVQHIGSENPAFVRRQHGLQAYLSNYDMDDNYEFAYGPWNDRSLGVYRPFVLAYPISDGLVDTLQWQGFRSGVDDIRYATKLRQLADEAIASGNIDRVDAGKKVRQWFAMLDSEKMDLNEVRAEMIAKIDALREMN
jgi:hypothetical protein